MTQKIIFSLLAMFLAAGCQSAPVSVKHNPNPAPGEPSLHVTVDPQQYARGCSSVTITTAGDVEILMQQDGTSDWLGLRILPAIGAEAAGAVMAVVGAPFELIAQAFDLVPEVPAPSAIHGCDGMFAE